MQFRILVDRPLDGANLTPLLQNLQMFVKISVASRGLRHVVIPAGTRLLNLPPCWNQI
jgi:hypothetical protein